MTPEAELVVISSKTKDLQPYNHSADAPSSRQNALATCGHSKHQSCPDVILVCYPVAEGEALLNVGGTSNLRLPPLLSYHAVEHRPVLLEEPVCDGSRSGEVVRSASNQRLDAL